MSHSQLSESTWHYVNVIPPDTNIVNTALLWQKVRSADSEQAHLMLTQVEIILFVVRC